MTIATRAKAMNRQPLILVAVEADAAFSGLKLTQSKFQDSTEILCNTFWSVANWDE